ncbi:30S ribosome-binding factor RbfA [Euzebya sp.]|uniref:30S ribosome-binding factor RbfA n=1 Tax=Euzebya sp. TaxID=1971409 RepID=UPI0035130DA9
MSSPEKGRRLAERVKELVGAMLPKVKDPRVGFVTITDVRMSRDNELATVYYTVLPDTAVERERTAAGLESASGLIRRDLGQALGVRKVPEVVFAIDDVADRGRRIEAILDSLADSEQGPARPDAQDVEAGPDGE